MDTAALRLLCDAAEALMAAIEMTDDALVEDEGYAALERVRWAMRYAIGDGGDEPLAECGCGCAVPGDEPAISRAA